MKQRTKQKLANAEGNLAKAVEAVCSLSHEELQELADEVMRKLNGAPIPKGKYMTIEEVCQYLKVGRTTVWRYSKAGILKPKKIGYKILYARADIDEHFNNEKSHE